VSLAHELPKLLVALKLTRVNVVPSTTASLMAVMVKALNAAKSDAVNERDAGESVTSDGGFVDHVMV